MTGDRRKFNHQPKDARRDALIAAAIALVSEGGAGGPRCAQLRKRRG